MAVFHRKCTKCAASDAVWVALSKPHVASDCGRLISTPESYDAFLNVMEKHDAEGTYTSEEGTRMRDRHFRPCDGKMVVQIVKPDLPVHFPKPAMRWWKCTDCGTHMSSVDKPRSCIWWKNATMDRMKNVMRNAKIVDVNDVRALMLLSFPKNVPECACTEFVPGVLAPSRKEDYIAAP